MKMLSPAHEDDASAQWMVVLRVKAHARTDNVNAADERRASHHAPVSSEVHPTFKHWNAPLSIQSSPQIRMRCMRTYAHTPEADADEGQRLVAGRALRNSVRTSTSS